MDITRRDCLRQAGTLLAGGFLVGAAPAGARDDGGDAVDVCVYGGTASGIMAAVAAAREGARVVMVEPSRWLGGMTGGGTFAGTFLSSASSFALRPNGQQWFETFGTDPLSGVVAVHRDLPGGLSLNLFFATLK